MIAFLDFVAQHPEPAIAVLMAVIAAGAWLGARITQALPAWMHSVTLSAGHVIRSIVEEVGQTYVDALREGRYDGKLTEEEAEEAVSRAWDRAVELLPWKWLRRALGGQDKAEQWARTEIEAAVSERKRAQAAANPPQGSRSTE